MHGNGDWWMVILSLSLFSPHPPFDVSLSAVTAGIVLHWDSNYGYKKEKNIYYIVQKWTNQWVKSTWWVCACTSQSGVSLFFLVAFLVMIEYSKIKNQLRAPYTLVSKHTDGFALVVIRYVCLWIVRFHHQKCVFIYEYFIFIFITLYL